MIRVLSALFFLVAVCEQMSAITITRTITVGPCDLVGYKPLQWSPGGERLAYFSGCQLMLADTAGKTWSVATVKDAPHSFAWSTNNEILVHTRRQETSNSIVATLVAVDANTGNSVSLYRDSVAIGKSATTMSFQGPYAAQIGAGYYVTFENGDRVVNTRESKTTDRPALVSRIVADSDAVYVVDELNATKEKISSKPYKPYAPYMINVSPTREYLIMGGTLVHLPTDGVIVLDTFPDILNRPPGTMGCGLGDGEFDITGRFLFIRVGCDDGHFYSVHRVFVYDCALSTLQELDALLNLSECSRPTMNTKCSLIALSCDNVVTLAEWRE